jgi:16S rRNA (uracil1498-N3)-methyltransferase
MRRFPAERVEVGEITLPAETRRHAIAVLRLGIGDAIELFDAGGRSGIGTIVAVDPLIVRIDAVTEPAKRSPLVIASAVPKGERADWMVEKLSELGVDAWVPLRTARSVVHPDGTAKFERWKRIAAEASRQCGRAGVMEIRALTAFATVLGEANAATTSIAVPGAATTPVGELTLIGPEGGWDEAELASAASAGIRSIGLAPTVLRVETAAVAAAVLAAVPRSSAVAE